MKYRMQQRLVPTLQLHVSELLWEVDLVINDKSIAEDLVSDGHAAFLTGIANSSTKDFISSVEVFQVLTGPIFEQRFHKNNDELTVLPNEEPIIKKFESIIQQNRTLATDFECCFSFTVMLDKRNVANYNFQKGCNMVGNCRVNCADLMNFFRLG
ncbi:dual specificity protein phosphatase 23 isoform X3 [Heterodontus francisci]|uniref:dual specificity protein phosphatase 23 isoform X3 n=1 Tax=Heterodontus francisci TaxID=7792 RepID=UPI00355C0CA4